MPQAWRTCALALVALLASSATARAVPPEQRTQFVLFSLDTTPGPDRPVERSAFHSLLAAMNQRVAPGQARNGYTLFIISGGLQLHPARRLRRALEQPLRGLLPLNRPVVRYARDLAYVRAKAANIRELSEAGVEIGSHAVRHDHGRAWDLARWRYEIRDHDRISSLLDLPRPLGFRAPFLEWNEHLYTALAESGIRYDCSRTGGHAWPRRHPRTGLWLFSVPTVQVPGYEGEVLYFDDNMRRVLGPMARSRGLRGEAAERWMEEVYVEVGLEAFERRYQGNRAPFLVSGHGTLRAASMRLLRRVCRREGVRCATFMESVRYLEAHPELEGAPPLHGQVVGPAPRRRRS